MVWFGLLLLEGLIFSIVYGVGLGWVILCLVLSIYSVYSSALIQILFTLVPEIRVVYGGTYG